MTRRPEEIIFFETSQKLHHLLQEEQVLLEQKDYTALSLLWHEKGQLVQSYIQHAKNIQKRQPSHIDIRFRELHECILAQAQQNDAPLRRLYELSHTIVSIIQQAAHRQDPEPVYGPGGILNTQDIQSMKAFKTDHYF